MEASYESTDEESTNILNLNDHCLRQVFDKMVPYDLGGIADVCSRFRQNAQACVAVSKFMKVNAAILRRGEISDEPLPRVSRSLRNFGEFISAISASGSKYKPKEQHGIIELIRRYCSETLIELKLYNFFHETTDESLTCSEQPMFRHLEKMEFKICNLNKFFLNVSPIWFPALQELYLAHIEDAERFDGLQQNFSKLESITLHQVSNLWEPDIVEILKCNPQLKIAFFEQLDFFDEISDRIFQPIAKYAPRLEELCLRNIIQTNDKNVEFIGKLKKLKTLQIAQVAPRITWSIIRNVGMPNIQLECLCLDIIWLTIDFDQLIAAFPNLKKLKTLELKRLEDFSVSHICQLCGQLPELNELQLFDNNFVLSAGDILDLVENANTLQLLRYCEPNMKPQPNPRVHINGETFMKIVKLIEKRPLKQPLRIVLDCKCFTADIPAKLVAMHKDMLELSIEE